MTEPHPDDPPAARHPRHRALPGRRGAGSPATPRVLKLSSNENPFGPSPAARDGVQRAPRRACISTRTPTTPPCAPPSPRCTASTPARIVCGAGSDEIIAFLTQAYAGPGTEVIHTEHGFGMYRIGALAAGATPVEVPERERRTDVDAILAACTAAHGARLLRQPQQPDRHDDPGGRGRAPRRRPAAAGAPGARRRLCRVRRAASTATPTWSTRATTW